MTGTGLVQFPLCISDLNLGAIPILGQLPLLLLQPAKLAGQGTTICLRLVALQVLADELEVVADECSLLKLAFDIGEIA